MRTVVIQPHYGGPKQFVTVPDSYPSHKVVEKVQRNLARMGYRTGCSWQVIDGGFIDAVIEETVPE